MIDVPLVTKVKTKKSCVSYKMFEVEFKFSKIAQKRCVQVSLGQQNGWLLLVQHTLCVTDKVNKFLLEKRKKNEKNEKKKSKSVKSLRYCGLIFFPTNDFLPLECCHLYMNAKYKASSCCKIEAVIQRCSVKTVFLKILEKIHRKTLVPQCLFK